MAIPHINSIPATPPTYNYQTASSINHPVFHRAESPLLLKPTVNEIETTPSFKNHAHDKDDKSGKDPYLRTEAELAGKDFDDPFFYPIKRKILKKGRGKKHGKKGRY